MAKVFQAVRGMNDLLPAEMAAWQYVEDCLRQIVTSYDYQQIRFPIIEQTGVFSRTIGEVTDIVEKEMYTFADRNGDSLTLRPEGTAGCMRAGIEHGLFYNQQQRLWYLGPMFRHERPQKGRCRQFQQLGVEAVGFSGPDVDAEQMLMIARVWRKLGLEQHLKLQINSLGTSTCRSEYRHVLVSYFKARRQDLDEESLKRLSTNPLRILDSKNPAMQALISQAPKLADYLDTVSQQHFTRLCHLLDSANCVYEINPRLVRGLDYYCHTVYEWVTDKLGAQGTVCAGGRYDGLVEQLGGKPTPGTGFAMGLERVVELLTMADNLPSPASLDVFLILMGEEAEASGLFLAEKLRDQLPNLTLQVNCGGGNFKNQFKRADKSGARIAVIVGDDELKQHKFGVKYLREEREQALVDFEKLVKLLSTCNN